MTFKNSVIVGHEWITVIVWTLMVFLSILRRNKFFVKTHCWIFTILGIIAFVFSIVPILAVKDWGYVAVFVKRKPHAFIGWICVFISVLNLMHSIYLTKKKINHRKLHHTIHVFIAWSNVISAFFAIYSGVSRFAPSVLNYFYFITVALILVFLLFEGKAFVKKINKRKDHLKPLLNSE
eukprot:TRINITY_DN1803_c0_g1_i1.p1 TRINITY_DN1803_c0_g1~~TRINITY_DN1803_c0_g1_i1.p1  ORF type:complete len:179 (+),score=35.01 TRINITY_DN1803_c0_g1_i1:59-595(+)